MKTGQVRVMGVQDRKLAPSGLHMSGLAAADALLVAASLARAEILLIDRNLPRLDGHEDPPDADALLERLAARLPLQKGRFGAVLVLAESYQPYPAGVYRRGFKAIISPIRRNSQSPLSKLKSTSYLESILARQQARAAGADEAICLNEKGLLAEASMSNIFLVKQGALITPGPESGILAGITRQIVLELATNLGIEAREQDVRPEELYDAQEALLTSSLIEVMPLTRIEAGPVASGEPGPITGRLMTAYRELVLSELGRA